MYVQNEDQTEILKNNGAEKKQERGTSGTLLLKGHHHSSPRAAQQQTWRLYPQQLPLLAGAAAAVSNPHAC